MGDLDVLAENKESGYLTIDVRKKTSGRAVSHLAARLGPPLILNSCHSQEQAFSCLDLSVGNEQAKTNE